MKPQPTLTYPAFAEMVISDIQERYRASLGLQLPLGLVSDPPMTLKVESKGQVFLMFDLGKPFTEFQEGRLTDVGDLYPRLMKALESAFSGPQVKESDLFLLPFYLDHRFQPEPGRIYQTAPDNDFTAMLVARRGDYLYPVHAKDLVQLGIDEEDAFNIARTNVSGLEGTLRRLYPSNCCQVECEDPRLLTAMMLDDYRLMELERELGAPATFALPTRRAAYVAVSNDPEAVAQLTEIVRDIYDASDENGTDRFMPPEATIQTVALGQQTFEIVPENWAVQ